MHPRFQTAFAQLADNLQSALEPILADKYFPALLTGEQVSSLKSATGLDEDALAFALLPLAAAVRVRHCRILMLAQLRAV
ncbi:Cytidine deaminase [Klebsiella pneumoniae IS22]|nr:Cytidine deaminase [Klebsiella pneumoniae IS22]